MYSQIRKKTKKKAKKKSARFPDYEVVIMKNVVTFGTTVFIRKDKRALIIVFPCGQELHFKPEDEIKKLCGEI